MVSVALFSYAILAWFRMRLALGLLLAFLPAYLIRFSIAGIPMTMLEGMILVLTAAMLLRGVGTSKSRSAAQGGERAERERPSAGDPWVLWPIVWMAVGLIATLGSPAGMQAWGIWKAYIVEPVFLFWILRAMRRDLDPFRHLIIPLAIGGAWVAGVAVWQHWTGYGIPFPWFDPIARRVTSVFGYPNAVGLFLAPLIPLLIGSVIGVRTRIALRLFLTAAAMLSLIAIFLTRGAGAQAAAVVGLVAITVLFAFRKFLARHATGATLIVLAGWVIASLLLTAWLPYRQERPRTGPPLWQKLTFQQWSGSVRLSQYRETWELLREHPLGGAGLAGYRKAIVSYHEKSDVEIFTYPHNLFLAVWSELGFIGLLVFLVLLYQFLRAALVASSPFVLRVSAASMIALLLFGLVDIPFFKNDLAVMFWVIIALGIHPRAPLE